jgi:hypothetical protein
MIIMNIRMPLKIAARRDGIDFVLKPSYFGHNHPIRRPNVKKKRLPIFVVFIGVLLSSVFLGLARGAEQHRVALPDVVPLKLRYNVGETLYYRLVRQNNNFRMDGTKSGEMKVVTYFTRTRLPDDGQGCVQEKFVWKRFEFGQSMTAAPAKLAEFKGGEGFSLVYSVNDADAIYKLDFSSLPRTFEGFIFMILTWDAVTFDGLTRPTQYLSVPDTAPIGAEFKETREAPDLIFSYPPLVSESRYHFSGKGWIRVNGISMIKGMPCVIVESANLENTVEMNISIQSLNIKTQGLEHFWAKTYLSLADGRIVRGELVGPVAMIQDVRMPGREKPDHSEFVVIGYLDMDLLSEAEFNAELGKTK